MNRNSTGIAIVIMLISGLILTSCLPQKRLRYLQPGETGQPTDSLRADVPVHIIAPYDLLHVQIISMSAELSKVPGYDGGTNVGTDASIFLQGYAVAENGTITLPVLGEIKAEGLTAEALQQQLTTIAREKISLDAEVFVRLLNFRITVLGEVKTPGVINIYDQRISVLDALAMAGDLTTYGDREKVMLVRDQDGKKEIFYIDLTRTDLLKSPHYYLKSHDVIYVQPLDAKTYGFGQVNWGVIFSSLSTLIAILAIVIK